MSFQPGTFDDPDELPTFEQIRTEAYRLLGDAQDTLRSDWRRGTGPAGDQSAHLTSARQHIEQAMAALNRAAST